MKSLVVRDGKALTVLVLLMSCGTISLAAQREGGAPVARPADAVYVNGKVFTADDRSSMAEGFAVKDGHFVGVGSSAEMKAYIGKGTAVVDTALIYRQLVPWLICLR